MPVWPFIAMFLAGSYMQYRENKDISKRQQAAIERGLGRQQEKREERTELLKDYGDETLDQQAQAELLGQTQEAATSDIMDVISANEQTMNAPTYATSRVSGDVQEAGQASKLNTLKKLSDMAQMRGKTQGMIDLDFANQMTGNRYDIDVGGVNTEADIMKQTDEALTQFAGMPNHTRQFMAGLLQQLGMMGAMGSMSGSVAPAPQAAAGAAVPSKMIGAGGYGSEAFNTFKRMPKYPGAGGYGAPAFNTYRPIV